MQRRLSHWILAGLALCSPGLIGCETAEWKRFFPDPIDMAAEQRGEIEKRKTFQTTRSREALHWLLAHRIQSGMSHGEVSRVLGEEGVREFNDRWLKNQGSQIQVSDIIYRFGPDNAGQSIYLAFRDDKLVNFEPDNFRDDESATPAGLLDE